jgi:hypothetical protein
VRLGERDQPPGDLDLALGGLGHARLVDGQRDHRGAELLREREALGGRLLAVLEVDRVDHGLAAVQLERRLEDPELGRIEHQRTVDRAAQAADDLMHVGDLVAADVGGADIQSVRALFRLGPPDRHAGIPVLGRLALAERLGAVGITTLADRQIGVLLAERHRGIERSDLRLPLDRAHLRPGPLAILGEAPEHAIQLADVRRRGAAATADDRHAVLDHEPLEPGGKLARTERIVGLAVDQGREAGVRQDRDRAGPGARQVGHMLGHLLGAGGAVQADDRDVERADDGRGGADVGADQHGAGGLDGDLNHERKVLACLAHRPLGAVHGRLHLERVLAGLAQDDVGAAGDQPRRLDGERVLERAISDVTERG